MDSLLETARGYQLCILHWSLDRILSYTVPAGRLSIQDLSPSITILILRNAFDPHTLTGLNHVVSVKLSREYLLGICNAGGIFLLNYVETLMMPLHLLAKALGPILVLNLKTELR